MTNIEKQEKHIRQLKSDVAMGKALDALLRNKAFKILILEGYFVTEAANQVVKLSQPEGNQTPEAKNNIMDTLRSISHLQAFFNDIADTAEMSNMRLEDNELELEKQLEEGL